MRNKDKQKEGHFTGENKEKRENTNLKTITVTIKKKMEQLNTLELD